MLIVIPFHVLLFGPMDVLTVDVNCIGLKFQTLISPNSDNIYKTMMDRFHFYCGSCLYHYMTDYGKKLELFYRDRLQNDLCIEGTSKAESDTYGTQWLHIIRTFQHRRFLYGWKEIPIVVKHGNTELNVPP